MRRIDKKGFVKGLTTVSIVIAVALAVIFTVFYVFTAFANVSLTSNNAVYSNATFDTNQTGIDLNLTINITSMSGGQITPIKTIYINISEAGFVNITATNLRCPDNSTNAHATQVTWNASSPNTGVLACNASTSSGADSANNTLTGIVNLTIRGLTARSSQGAATFNVSVQYNQSGFISNSTIVTITTLQLGAGVALNDTSSPISGQKSYNFTITNNVTGESTDSINEIRIYYTGPGFSDTGGSNVTCPTIGDAWTLTNNSVSNIITCSKSALASPLGAGSSTSIIVEKWGAPATGGSKNFEIIVNGTAGGGTYNVSSEQRPAVTVYGTLGVTSKNLAPSKIGINASNITFIQFNFTATGENMNITTIKVTRSGTSQDADFTSIRLVNDTDREGNFEIAEEPVYNASLTTVSSKYEFTGIKYIVPAGDSNTLFLAVNVSAAATAGRTFSFDISSVSGDINTDGVSSNINITETNTTTLASSTATIYGKLVVKGFNLAPVTKVVGTTNLALAYLEFNATGEGMNITSMNITRTGSSGDSDVNDVRLFVDTNTNAAFDSGTDTQLGSSLNTSSSGQYIFSGFQYNVSTSAANRIFIITNINSTATGGNIFSFGLNRTGDINAIGATTTENVTGTNNISFVSAQSGTTQIHGTLAIAGTNVIGSTVEANSTNVTVIKYNFTAVGENMIIGVLNITRNETAADADMNLLTLYNDTDGSGAFNVADERLSAFVNSSTSGVYMFTGLSFNVTPGRVNTLFLVINVTNTATTGGKTFRFTLANVADVSAVGSSSVVNLTSSTNITLATMSSTRSKIFGTLSAAAADLTPDTANTGQKDVSILKLTFTAVGEIMNLTQLNVTVNATSTADVSTIKLYNDTDGSGTVSASSDTLLATGSSLVVNVTRFLLNYSLPTSNSTVLILAYDIASGATGGNRVDGYVNAQADIIIVGNASGQNINTAGSYKLNAVGDTLIKTLSATAVLDFTSTRIAISDNYNVTVSNTGSDDIDRIIVDYTDSAYTDPTAGNVACPTIAAGAWTKALDGDANTVTCTSPAGANNLLAGSKVNVTIKSFQASVSAGLKTFTVQVRGTAAGTYNVTTNVVTVSGYLNVTGTNQIATKVAVNSKNVSVISYKFIASGEQMNVSVIKLTRAGTSREADIASVKMFNDTNGDGTYTATTDTMQIGSTATANNTGGQYQFTGLTFYVPTSGNMTLFAVVELAGTTATGGKTLILNLNETADVNAIASTTGTNTTENLTGTASTESTIFSTLTVIGKNLAATTVGFNTSGLAVMQLNFTTVGGEQINITNINLTRLGTVVDGDIFNVSLYNDTDSSGTFNAGDTPVSTVGVNTTTAGLYRFSSMNFNLTTTTKTLIVVVSINDTNAGSTFNLSINATGNINAFATVGNMNLTGSTNITLTTATSSTVTIAGGFSITGTNLAPTTKVISTAGLSVLQLNFVAIGEGMNISVIKITRKGTATDSDIYNVTLYNDTDLSGAFNAGDVAIGTVGVNTTSASQYAFTGFQYNITSGGTKTLFVVVSINSTAGASFNLSINATDDINTIAATTAQNVTEVMSGIESSSTTIHGKVTVTGKTIAPATKVINSADLAVLQLNFTATGEAMNVSLVNFSLVGTATEANLTNMRLFNDTDGNGQFGSGTDTLISPVLNTTSGALVSFSSMTHIVNTGGVNTIFVVVNISGIAGTGGKTLNFSINNTGDVQIIGRSTNLNFTASSNITLTTPHSAVATTIYGLMQIRGKNLAISATTPPTANFSVLLLNITATGEGMNITVLNITRMGTATDGNLTNLRIFNDTDLSGTFSGGDEQVFGAVSSSTAGMYKFNGTQFNVSAGSDKTLILVLNVTSTATGAATFNFSINNTGDVSVITEASSLNITGTTNITLTSTLSSTTTINAISIVGTDLIAADPNKNAGSEGFYEIPSVEGNVAAMRINFTSSGEGMNITLIKLVRGNGTGSVTDAYIVNARLFNDTNANGKFDSGTDTQIGSAVSTTSAEKYEFTGFQYNTTTSGVNSLFVVFNTSDLAWNPQGIMFNLSLASTGDINTLGAVTGANLSETLTTVSIATTRITYRGWYNFTPTSRQTGLEFGAGWNDFTMPIQSMLEGTGRTAASTGNFNFTSILSSLGSNWRYMYYNINGSSTGWVLADRTDPGGSTLQYVNNTNDRPYWINMTAVDRFEL